MSANDVILLKERIEAARQEADSLSASEQEVYFFAKHYLKAFSPTHDDLLAGIVDGANDGGLDGIYIFVNGNCVRDDVRLRGMGFGAELQLIICQVKNTTGFGEDAVDKTIIHLPELLSFDRDEKALSARFNGRVIEITRRFLRVLQDLDMPDLSIFVTFASLRAANGPHPNVLAKAGMVEDAVKACFGSSSPSVSFLDAASVGEYTRFSEPTTKELVLSENPLSTDTAGGYIGVVSLDAYNRFITDDSGRLDGSMFDANVRDYESGSGVNESIQETLEEIDPEVDFWWLNNGVTVVADRVQPNGKRLKLKSPQVVNGLQTSHEIYKRGTKASLDSNRSVLVKVIEADKEDTKDRIIKATNSQTTLGTSTLRATDTVQRKIEEYLITVGLHYERRKNFYRNQNIPHSELVSIDQLGQAVTAALAQAPHIARGEVSRIFEDETYRLVFHESYPLATYSQAITLFRECERFLQQEPTTRGEVENFTFHLTTLAAIALTRKRQPRAEDLAKLDSLPSSELLQKLLPIVRQAFTEVVNSKDYVLFDQVAKDPLSTVRLLEGAQRYLARRAG